MNKSVIQTTKQDSRPNTSVARTIKKPVAKKANQKTTQLETTDTNIPKTEILETTSRVKVTHEIVFAYIDNYKTVAQANMKKYGIPASIILGQAILESGSGTGILCVQANNHFGIKCHKDWLGSSVRYDDDSADECFRKYDNPIDSFRDHSLFLTGRTWYSALFKLKKTDYKAWAKGLKDAGYATDTQYPNKLIALIERYQLFKYDVEGLGKLAGTKNENLTILSEYDRYVVTKGDTLYSISKKYNISIEDLKKRNNLFDNAISIGQSILILK